MQNCESANIINNKKVINFIPYIFIFIFSTFILYTFWPGVLTPDSSLQYQQALVGTYSDHHPPMMAFYWSFLNFIYPGTGLMFTTHVLLLWLSSFLFLVSCQRITNSKLWPWFFVLIPLWPQLFGYSLFVLKDSSFALSFILSASILTVLTFSKEKIGWKILLTLGLLIFYGASVKFQGIYVMPVLLLWISFLIVNKTWKKRTYLLALFLISIFIASIIIFNKVLTSKENHSWQHVKIFDLAAISLQVNKPLFPDFIKKYPNFSMNKLEKNFSQALVDTLYNDTDRVIIKGENDQERNEILQYWYKAVWDHPLEYLSHRYKLQQIMFNKYPIKSLDNMHHPEMVPGIILKIMGHPVGASLINLLREATTFKYYFPLLCLYFVIGLVRMSRTLLAVPLTMMSGMGLLLIAVLFPFSMASDLRYIYLPMCCLHFCHFFAYQSIFNKNKDFIR